MEKKLTGLPIGVFDSGVGGLTVLMELQKALPNESFLYLGDTARLPYGTKGQDTIKQYALQATKALVERGVKCVVIACNTVSAIALTDVQQQFPYIPIIGVLQPGAYAACMATKNSYIAVLATEATANARGYENAIAELRPDAFVHTISARIFVALAEEGWGQDPIAVEVARKYLAPILNHEKPFDCLILGCTHFPVLYNAIREVVGHHMIVVDSAKTTCTAVTDILKKKHLFNKQKHQGDCTFLVTDAPSQFAKVAERLLKINLDIINIEHIAIG